ncbi:MAG: hypothetical protein K2G83_03610 [Ruminococcus sp.]|nr:hypothetical protein [Ruminococcus sp.]
MKRVLKKITASLMSGLMLFSSTYAVVGSASATSKEVQPRTWYIYGDVDNNGKIDVLDVISVNKAVKTFNDLTGSSELPLEFAVARPSVYFGNQNDVPQAADIDGDGYITKQDSEMIMKCIVGLEDEAGRCGQPFFIN